jgi:hypothetical protein
MRRQVDTLLRHVWHYFDCTVVHDGLTPLLAEEWEGSKQELIRQLVSQLSALIYVNEIGAADLLEFSSKEFCREHYEDHAKEQGLEWVLKRKQELVSYLLDTAEFYPSSHDGNPTYAMKHSELPSTVAIFIGQKKEGQLRRELAGLAYSEVLTFLTGDLGAAKERGIPLGTVLGLQGRILQANRPPTAPEVMFHLRLPVLESVPAGELIEIRKNEEEYFIGFRTALVKAVEERIRLGNAESATRIAEQIRLELIEPALESIRLRLAKSEKTLAKKAGVGAFLGALATTCGVLYGLAPPLAMSAGIGTVITTTGLAANKHLEEQQLLSLDDMYFLWKAVEHSHK